MAPIKKTRTIQQDISSTEGESMFNSNSIEQELQKTKDASILGAKKYEPLKHITNISSGTNKTVVKELDAVKKTRAIGPTMPNMDTPKKEKKINIDYMYYLYFAEDESEYFTFTAPVFDGNIVIIENPIKKGTLKTTVLNKNIFVEYNDSTEGMNSIEIDLSTTDDGQGGAIIKCVRTEQLDWLGLDENSAQEKMKDLKLQLYEKYEQRIAKGGNVNPRSVQEINKFGTTSNNGRLRDL